MPSSNGRFRIASNGWQSEAAVFAVDAGFTARRDTPVELGVRTRRRSHARRLPNMYALL